MRKSMWVVLAAVLVTSTALHAQKTGHVRYRWHDAKGLPHYSDSLTAEAMKYGYDLVNDRGFTVGHVQRQLSPEERDAARQAEAKQAAAKRDADERARSDRQLLDSYPDEAAYQQAQQQQLDTFDQQMKTTRINLHSQEKALADLLARAADLERAKDPVPKYLTDSIAKQRDVVNGQRARLDRQQASRTKAEQQANAQLQHYRDLKAAQAQR